LTPDARCFNLKDCRQSEMLFGVSGLEGLDNASTAALGLILKDKRAIRIMKSKQGSRTFVRLMVMGLALAIWLAAPMAWAGLDLGEVPKDVVLEGDLGGRLDGTPWSTGEMAGKVTVIFYVDPDEKDLNNEASDALQKENFPRDRYQTFAVINMDATWLPNFAISSALKEKQKKYPTATYVRDYKKVLVKAWGIADDNSDVLAFDKHGRLVFKKYGKLNDGDIQELIRVIRGHLHQ